MLKSEWLHCKELLNRSVTEVFPNTYSLCTWLCVDTGQTETDTISPQGLDSRWESYSMGSRLRRLELLCWHSDNNQTYRAYGFS